jgi:hypothetical protein
MHPLSSRTMNSAVSAPATVAPEPAAVTTEGTADEMRQLTLQIDNILAGRPPASRTSTPFLAMLITETGFPSTGERFPSTGDVFDGAPSEKLRATMAAPDQAAGWLVRAKRERRFERVRSAVFWAVALGFAVIIVGAAAFVVRGGSFGAAKFNNAVSALGF